MKRGQRNPKQREQTVQTFMSKKKSNVCREHEIPDMPGEQRNWARKADWETLGRKGLPALNLILVLSYIHRKQCLGFWRGRLHSFHCVKWLQLLLEADYMSKETSKVFEIRWRISSFYIRKCNNILNSLHEKNKVSAIFFNTWRFLLISFGTTFAFKLNFCSNTGT